MLAYLIYYILCGVCVYMGITNNRENLSFKIWALSGLGTF